MIPPALSLRRMARNPSGVPSSSFEITASGEAEDEGALDDDIMGPGSEPGVLDAL